MQSLKESASSESVEKLREKYEGLKFERSGGLNAGDKFVFITMDHEPEIIPPADLPHVVQSDKIYFLIPADADESSKSSPWLSEDVCRDGVAFIPAGHWPSIERIKDAVLVHRTNVLNAQLTRGAHEVLESERSPHAGLYASASQIEDTAPMLIDGLMRERGVSVMYGDFDEFKTTMALDMAAHIAAGAPWQGRAVMPRPVIWYALEGADEIPVRLRALEGRFRKVTTAWGDDRLPITVLDRIPDDPVAWRAEITQLADRWERLTDARRTIDENLRYPGIVSNAEPLVVVDTLSLALGGDDEKGPRAVGFINECLDLLKKRPDLACPALTVSEEEQWLDENPTCVIGMEHPVASHVLIIHHQTKTGIDFAGHRAIGGNTHGLYRVHRFGKMTDAQRPYSGQLTPMRVKGIPRPAPIRFDVEVIPVDGTKRTAALIKDRASAIPEDLGPVIDALRQLEDYERISSKDLNDCLDVVAAKGGRSDVAKRKARQRSREMLVTAGVIEPLQDDDRRDEFYRFHDPIKP